MSILILSNFSHLKVKKIMTFIEFGLWYLCIGIVTIFIKTLSKEFKEEITDIEHEFSDLSKSAINGTKVLIFFTMIITFPVLWYDFIVNTFNSLKHFYSKVVIVFYLRKLCRKLQLEIPSYKIIFKKDSVDEIIERKEKVNEIYKEKLAIQNCLYLVSQFERNRLIVPIDSVPNPQVAELTIQKTDELMKNIKSTKGEYFEIIIKEGFFMANPIKS